ncbi:hypothetical protein J6590_082949 [Homalodisca vitripennis]|nr:hypothetical protein J6590_082949 [Homalodisca vitripennis]
MQVIKRQLKAKRNTIELDWGGKVCMRVSAKIIIYQNSSSSLASGWFSLAVVPQPGWGSCVRVSTVSLQYNYRWGGKVCRRVSVKIIIYQHSSSSLASGRLSLAVVPQPGWGSCVRVSTVSLQYNYRWCGKVCRRVSAKIIIYQNSSSTLASGWLSLAVVPQPGWGSCVRVSTVSLQYNYRWGGKVCRRVSVKIIIYQHSSSSLASGRLSLAVVPQPGWGSCVRHSSSSLASGRLSLAVVPQPGWGLAAVSIRYTCEICLSPPTAAPHMFV